MERSIFGFNIDLRSCSLSMYFGLDPESAYEAALQRVQENESRDKIQFFLFVNKNNKEYKS
jgi:hypothetical protein